MSRKTLLTTAELEQMPDVDSVRTELDEGELITWAPASGFHGRSEVRILVLLEMFTRQHKLGKVYPGDTGFQLNDHTVRLPDIAFVRNPRASAVGRKGFVQGAPDLAVEVFSPNDSVPQLMRKVTQYFAAGCHTVWIVYPERQEVDVHEASGVERLLTADDTIEAADLLPGFSVPISEFFE